MMRGSLPPRGGLQKRLSAKKCLKNKVIRNCLLCGAEFRHNYEHDPAFPGSKKQKGKPKMTSNKTVEQLREELRIAQEAVAQQEQALRDKAREEKLAAERKIREAEEAALAAKMRAVLEPVHVALVAAGVKCHLQDKAIAVEGNIGDIFVERERAASSSRWSCGSYTERFVLVIDSRYTNDFPKVRYPQLKAGGFNTAKIAETVQRRLAIVTARIVEEKRAAAKKATGAELAAQLKQELGLDVNASMISATQAVRYPKGGGRSEYHEYTAEPGHVYMALGTQQLNPAQVRVMYAALIECKRLATKKVPS